MANIQDRLPREPPRQDTKQDNGTQTATLEDSTTLLLVTYVIGVLFHYQRQCANFTNTITSNARVLH